MDNDFEKDRTKPEKEITCVDCKNNFWLTKGEVFFFTNSITRDGKPMSLPKRCIKCREKKRLSNNKNNYARITLE